MRRREGRAAAILAFFGVEAKKVASVGMAVTRRGTAGASSTRHKLNPERSFAKLSFQANRQGSGLHADFFGLDPKKAPLF